jgi:hypothetical protein
MQSRKLRPDTNTKNRETQSNLASDQETQCKNAESSQCARAEVAQCLFFWQAIFKFLKLYIIVDIV